MTNTMTKPRSILVMPTIGYELDREEMSYVEGGDYYWSKETCFNVLAACGAIAYFGSVASILIGGTALYYSIVTFMAFASTALCSNPFTASIGLTIASFLITKGVEFVSCLVIGAISNGMTINTLKVFGIDTHVPVGFTA